MAIAPLSATALIEALDEPALIVEDGRTLAANAAARALFGAAIVGRDLRFAIRHPQALQAILAGKHRDLALLGIGEADQSEIAVLAGEDGLQCLRVADGEAEVAAGNGRAEQIAGGGVGGQCPSVLDDQRGLVERFDQRGCGQRGKGHGAALAQQQGR